MILISNNFFVKIITLNFAKAITIFPFIFLENKELKKDKVLLNHEMIHIRQQLEMLVIPFYIWYVIEFFIRLLKTKSRDLAYMNISFEKEAYANEAQLDYIVQKKFWSFIKYI